ncbi:MAG TPA: plasmid pRiA4b ORF-3 family protein [Drouetiella sp.]|jgi:Plasmid pRiA4b ORF-3-like protein
MAKKKVKPGLYQIRATLVDAPLPIWRRLQVPSDTQLELVHMLLQVAFGWTNSHLHEFTAREKRYGQMEFAEEDPELLDESEHNLDVLFQDGEKSALYRYDFGDCWDHELVLEKILPYAENDLMLGRCIAGKRACPPEDVGGVSGYKRFLDIIEDPEHEEREENLIWVGSDFDADSFDARLVNNQIRIIEANIVEDFAEFMAAQAAGNGKKNK